MDELAEYYRERAAEYDEVYAKPERQQDLARLPGLLEPMAAGRRVLEIAAGTGYWTRVLSGFAAAITATDLNAETLELARAREYGGAAVTFRLADAYALDQVPESSTPRSPGSSGPTFCAPTCRDSWLACAPAWAQARG